jgi:hypothetical protein
VNHRISILRRVAGWALAAAATFCAPAAFAATPVPTITGPIPVTPTSYPFGAADHTLRPENLSRYGYVEEEFFASGNANVYDWPAPGPLVVRTADAPYTTRVLVRRPANGRKFSGNVIVEFLNPSNLLDLNIGWALSGKHFMSKGDVWVGITSKPISVVSLKTFNPTRYAALSFANPLPLSDSRNCPVTGDTSRETENGLVWDIYAQVGMWLKSQAASNPLRLAAGFAVKNLYGFGYSQSGGFLYTYINGRHPLDVQQNGVPIYDAYVVAVAGGGFVGITRPHQCAPNPALTDARRQFNNVGVPIVHIMSQSDYLSGLTARRPDSDVFIDRYRHYEMTGAGHATPDELYYSAAPADIIAAGRAVPPLSCNEGPRSRFPSRIHFNAVWQNLDLWVRRGTPPPSASPMLVENGQGVPDAFGNIVGGLRSPYVDVPTSRWNGSSTGASFCFIAGHEVPFDATRLQQLYGNKGQYVQRVNASVKRLVAERFLTPADAVEVMKEASLFVFP